MFVFAKWNDWKLLRSKNEFICIIFYKYHFVHPHLFILISLIFVMAVVLDEKLDHRDILVGNWISSVRFFLISFIIQLDCCCNDDNISVLLEWGFQQCLDKEENCRPWISWNVTWAHDGPEIFWYSSISLILLFSFLLFFHFVFLYIRIYYSMCAWTDRGCMCAVCVTCQIQLWKFPYHVLQQYHRLIFSSSVLSKKEQISVHVLQQTFGI